MRFTDYLRGYRPFSDAETVNAWNEGLFCLDSNVLLDVYRYSDESREDFMNILRSIGPRMVVPARVAEEFARNRPSVITSRFKPHRYVRQKLKELGDYLEKEHKDHAEFRSITDFVGRIKDSENADFRDAEARQTALLDNDPILEELLAIVDNSVIEPVPVSELTKDFEHRKKELTPPFCKSDNKKDVNPEGDVAVWLELVQHCKISTNPLIFVTHDGKENWWLRTGERDVPQPLLVREFFDKTGQLILFYTRARFLDMAAKKLELKPSPLLSKEAKHLAIQEENEDRLRNFSLYGPGSSPIFKEVLNPSNAEKYNDLVQQHRDLSEAYYRQSDQNISLSDVPFLQCRMTSYCNLVGKISSLLTGAISIRNELRVKIQRLNERFAVQASDEENSKDHRDYTRLRVAASQIDGRITEAIDDAYQAGNELRDFFRQYSI